MTHDAFLSEPPSPNLFSFQKLGLFKGHFETIQKFIRATYDLRDSKNYQKKVLGHETTQKNKSVLMSFDFHIADDSIKLIEINTNASHFMTSYLMSDFVLQDQLPIADSLQDLQQSFLKEWGLFSGGSKKLSHICIVDEDPKTQRSYFEFLIYKRFFEDLGYSCTIEDYRNITIQNHALCDSQGKPIDLVYNRHTDFLFDHSPTLRQAYIEKLACISPHPEEYLLLADKNRLMQFSDSQFLKEFLKPEQLQLFEAIVPKIFEVNSKAKEEIWSLRKQYFFKPKNAFGGKGVFRGDALRHKAFDELYASGNYLAQELAPANEIKIQDQVSHWVNAKWDLRVYVYDGGIQHLTARAFVGQTTNFRTLGGGHVAVFLSENKLIGSKI